MRRLLLIPILSATLLSQVQPDLSVRDLLASSDSAQLAWGAELAARNGSQEFVPDLRGILGWTDDRVKEQALDALIRLKAKLPAAELTLLPQKFRDQVIILAIANGHRTILTSLLAENPRHGATWVALNEAVKGDPDYWEGILRDWTIHVAIYVTDPGRTAVIVPSGGGGLCGASLAEDRPGFPPRASYGLFLDPEPNDTVLISRPHVVYYRRYSGPSGCDIQIDRDDYRGDFISHTWSVYPPFRPLRGHMQFDLAWADDESYAAGVDRLRKETLASFQQILGRMVKSHRLPAQAMTLRPHIVVGFEDQRSNKSHPLPPTTPWE